MPFQVGETVGQYQIMEQLGQGGMATVYKAYHAALDRNVAIKVLHPAFTEDPSFLARFQREAKVVAKLDHPNIVPIYDFSQHNDQPYLVMKFIKGETLKARLGRGKMSLEDAMPIIEKVASALQYAHKKGIVHRDIKPSNVLLSEDGETYLTDFGLARIAQSGTSTLTSDQMVGTPQYISPEQAMSKTDLDFRTDIYSFGVMIYEIVVGRVPYNADTPFAVIHDHIYTPLPLPRKVNQKVPEGVEQVLLKALAKNPQDRFQDIGTMIKTLENAASCANKDAQTRQGLTPPPLPFMPLSSASTTIPSSEKGTSQISHGGIPRQTDDPGKAKIRTEITPDHITPPPIPKQYPKKRNASTFWLLTCLGILVIACVALAVFVLPRIINTIKSRIATAVGATGIATQVSDSPDGLLRMLFPVRYTDAKMEYGTVMGLIQQEKYQEAEQHLELLYNSNRSDLAYANRLVHFLLFFTAAEPNARSFFEALPANTNLPMEVAELRLQFLETTDEERAISIESQNALYMENTEYTEAYVLEIEIFRAARLRGWVQLVAVSTSHLTSNLVPQELKDYVDSNLDSESK
jgi:serine/threonine protein kinase